MRNINKEKEAKGRECDAFSDKLCLLRKRPHRHMWTMAENRQRSAETILFLSRSVSFFSVLKENEEKKPPCKCLILETLSFFERGNFSIVICVGEGLN